jgi:hypothetical protein
VALDERGQPIKEGLKGQVLKPGVKVKLTTVLRKEDKLLVLLTVKVLNAEEWDKTLEKVANDAIQIGGQRK